MPVTPNHMLNTHSSWTKTIVPLTKNGSRAPTTSALVWWTWYAHSNPPTPNTSSPYNTHICVLKHTTTQGVQVGSGLAVQSTGTQVGESINLPAGYANQLS